MAKTLAQLRSMLQTELRDPNDKTWGATSKNQYLNRAYFQIQKDGNFEWRENRTSSTLTSPYTIPTDFVIMELVRFGTMPLTIADPIELKRQGNDLTQTGNPTWYYFNSSTFGLYPVSTGSIEINYKKKLTKLTDDSDTIGFADDFAEAIVKYAKYLAWSSPRGNKQSAQDALSDYQEELIMLKSSYGVESEDHLTFGLKRVGRTSRANVL